LLRRHSRPIRAFPIDAERKTDPQTTRGRCALFLTLSRSRRHGAWKGAHPWSTVLARMIALQVHSRFKG